jgi:hypothetical protein
VSGSPRPNPEVPSPEYSIPSSEIRDPTPSPTVNVVLTGWPTLRSSTAPRSGLVTSTTVTSVPSPMRRVCRSASSRNSIGSTTSPTSSPISGPSAAGTPPNSPLMNRRNRSNWSGFAAPSNTKPSRHPPSLITAGVSATKPTDRLPTSTPSISPRSMCNTSTTVQRSCVAARERPLHVHGQITSQLQFSTYVPSNRNAIFAPLRLQ